MTPPRAFDFAGDVAIVTGAGSRMPGEWDGSGVNVTATRDARTNGILIWQGEFGNGRATAVLLARHGAKVALVDNNLDWVSETKRIIDNEGGTSLVIQADVTDEDACRGIVEKTVEAFGAVHILVNVGR